MRTNTELYQGIILVFDPHKEEKCKAVYSQEEIETEFYDSIKSREIMNTKFEPEQVIGCLWFNYPRCWTNITSIGTQMEKDSRVRERARKNLEILCKDSFQ